MAEHKKLIYADDLMAAFRSYMVEHYDRKKCVSEENCETCENGCLWRKIVSAAPTADAVEVVHARNLKVDSPSLFECSQCGWSDCDTYTGDTSEYNYCPNCGAKVDGGL